MTNRKKNQENESSDGEVEDTDMNLMLDSDEEISEDERKLLEKVRQKRQKENYDSEDEVMGFDDEDDEKDSLASDIEGLEEDLGLPNEKAWGKKKRAYYSTDYVDPDYASNTQKDIADAELEEEVARDLQKRIVEQLDEADFGLDLVTPTQDDSTFGKDGQQIKVDLSKLSKRQKQELLEKTSPEFMLLVADFQERMTEARTILGPFLNLLQKSNCPDCSATSFIKAKYDLTLNYCTNISFYLMLKAKRESAASHPVIKRLAQYRQLLSQLEEHQGNLLDEVKDILMADENGEPVFSLEANLNEATVKKTKKVHMVEPAAKRRKIKISEENVQDFDEDYTVVDDDELRSEASEEPEKSLHNESEEMEAEKRAITYEIAKNKGLTPHRKKEQRNPRVKHRNKYRKAIIRRKGAVREVRKEVSRYGGEISGIKASVKKSIKLK